MVYNFRQVGKKIIAAGKNYKYEYVGDLLLPLYVVINYFRVNGGPSTEAPKEPLLFLKPSSAFIGQGEKIKVTKFPLPHYYIFMCKENVFRLLMAVLTYNTRWNLV